MDKQSNIDQIASDLERLGVRRGGVLLMHSSLSALGYIHGGAETVILGLLQALGEQGTLLLPALSYENVNRRHPIFDVRNTPSCIGTIPEHFRTRPDTIRSLHPTHSVCGIGAHASELLSEHILDNTPVGSHSPFHLLPKVNGQILMLGCGLNPNTSMHGIEELSEPPYLYSDPAEFTLIDECGKSTTKQYQTHGFRGWKQSYDRVATYMQPPHLRQGKVMVATAHLIEAKALWETIHQIYVAEPLAFVARDSDYT